MGSSKPHVLLIPVPQGGERQEQHLADVEVGPEITSVCNPLDGLILNLTGIDFILFF